MFVQHLQVHCCYVYISTVISASAHLPWLAFRLVICSVFVVRQAGNPVLLLS
jgi:hypothetical protein